MLSPFSPLSPLGPGTVEGSPFSPFMLTETGFSRSLSFVQLNTPLSDTCGVKVAPVSPTSP